MGNITRIYSVNGSNETLLHLYTYDNNSQLTADMNSVDGTITDYSYDDGGNILQVKVSSWDRNTSNPVRGTEISRNTYSYTDDEWADLLTSYNGQTITYDAIGNPLSYRDGITMTWQNGRELATYADGTNSVSYSYEASGMRTTKAVTKGTTTDNYKYIYENGLLMQMRCNNIILDFTYGADGRPIGFAYRASAASTPAYYYYALNSRGDVAGLYNSSGALIVNYKYDAYGKLLGVTNSSGSAITAKYSYAILNPLRYRSYVYDTETGLYYLQTRYYDPTTCRFINADEFVSTGQDIDGYNTFAYCNNSPKMYRDVQGTIPAKDSGACGTYDPIDYRAYRLKNQTTIEINEEKNEIIAHFPIKDNPDASYLNDKQVAKKYSYKLHNHIENIASTSEQPLQVMSEQHIYSELLAHYYVYVGLESFPTLQGIPKLATAYEASTVATLNPSEDRAPVLFLMKIISWTY